MGEVLLFFVLLKCVWWNVYSYCVLNFVVKGDGDCEFVVIFY